MQDRWRRLTERLAEDVARRRLAVGLLLVLCSTPLVLFGLLDTRLPDDHDVYYTRTVVHPLQNSAGEGLGENLDALGALAVHGEGMIHPPLAQTALLAALQLFGTSLRVFRLALVPFLLLLLWATYRAGRELVGHRFGLLAAFVVGTLPVVLNYSRKWEPGLPNAALAALSVYLVIRVVRRPGSLGAWAALGAVQGLRMYVHPVAVPDVALWFTAAALGCVLTARKEGRAALGSWIRGAALAAGCFLAVGGWFLGLGGIFGVQPEYTLGNYLEIKVWGGTGEGAGDRRLTVLAAVGKLARDLTFVEWMPQYTLALFVPGALAAFAHPLLRERSAADSTLRICLLVLMLPLLASLPAAVFTTTRGCFTVDWMGLTAPTVLLCLASLYRFRVVIRRRLPPALPLYTGAILLVGGFHACVPLTLSLLGSDPYARPARELGPVALVYSFSEWGNRAHTHHLPFRSPSALGAVARTRTDGRKVSYCLWNLRYLPEYDGAAGSWLLEAPGVEGMRMLHNPWAAAFAERSVDRPLFQSCSEGDGQRHHVIRLLTSRPWQDGDLDDRPTDHAALEPRSIELAVETARQRLAPSGAAVTLLEDLEPSLYYDPAADRDTYLLQPRHRWFNVLTPSALPTRYLMRSIHIAPAAP